MFSGDWQADFGHENDSLPWKSTLTLPSALRNSTSDTPLPSVQGSQAETKLSDRLSRSLTNSGRPVTSTVTTGLPLPATACNTARSSGWRPDKRSVPDGPMSPSPSAYGVSPMTAMTASNLLTSTPAAFSLKVTLSAPAASRMPARMVSLTG